MRRRDLLGVPLLPLLWGPATLARAAVAPLQAADPARRRLVLVVLRGGLDGLALLPPVADPDYAAARGSLALPAGAVQPLDNLFGLHPACPTLGEWYRHGHLLPAHALASPFRGRSHFDAQDVLETGLKDPSGTSSGWLNRALAALPGAADPGPGGAGLAVAPSVPRVLQGAVPVGSWAPGRAPTPAADSLQRVVDLYAGDPLLGPALQQALAADALAGASGMTDRRAANSLPALARAGGRLLAADTGPVVLVLEEGGWDTHARQGAVDGALANHLGRLDRALAALREALGDAWAHTAVLVSTEFGRTVAVNGTAGTDHGTAGAALLAGGAVAGGRVLADWPGLAPAALHEGRDLRPTLDLRLLAAAVLEQHLGLPTTLVRSQVFPGLRGRAPDVTA